MTCYASAVCGPDDPGRNGIRHYTETLHGSHPTATAGCQCGVRRCLTTCVWTRSGSSCLDRLRYSKPLPPGWCGHFVSSAIDSVCRLSIFAHAREWTSGASAQCAPRAGSQNSVTPDGVVRERRTRHTVFTERALTLQSRASLVRSAPARAYAVRRQTQKTCLGPVQAPRRRRFAHDHIGSVVRGKNACPCQVRERYEPQAGTPAARVLQRKARPAQSRRRSSSNANAPTASTVGSGVNISFTLLPF